MSLEFRCRLEQNILESAHGTPRENSDNIPRGIQERMRRAEGRQLFELRVFSNTANLHAVPLHQFETTPKELLERTFLLRSDPFSAPQPSALCGFQVPSGCVRQRERVALR